MGSRSWRFQPRRRCWRYQRLEILLGRRHLATTMPSEQKRCVIETQFHVYYVYYKQQARNLLREYRSHICICMYIYIYVHIQYTCTSFHTLRSCIGDAAHVSPLSSTRSSQSCALVQFSPSVPDFVEEPKRVPRPSAIDSPVPKSAKRYSFGEVAFCRPMPSFYGNFTPQPSERPPVPSPLCPPKSFVRRGRPSPCGESVAAVARPAAASDSESDEAFLKKAREDSLSVRAVGGSLRRSYCEAAVEAGTAKTADLKSYKDLRNKVAEKN